MRCVPSVLLLCVVPACATDPLEERLDEPDVTLTVDCAGGTNEVEVEGTVVDYLTGEPVAGARVEMTEVWSSGPSFPESRCRLGEATTDASGRFGPVTLYTRDEWPTVAFLVTGAGRAPTISDTDILCFLNCYKTQHDIAAPSQDLALAWRHELYAGGMEYALNRGLVAYKFHDTAGKPAQGVRPLYNPHFLSSSRRPLSAGAEVRFLEADRQTLAPPSQTTTLASGTALIGTEPHSRGYFRVAGERGSDRWLPVGAIVATGWIFVESDTQD